MLMMKMSEKYATDNRRSPNLGGREGGRQKLTQSSLLRRFLAPWDTNSGQKEVIREIQKWRIQKVEPATDEFPCENAATEHSAAASAARRMRSSTIFLKRREPGCQKRSHIRSSYPKDLDWTSGRGPERGLYIPGISIGTLVLTGIWRG